MLPNTLDIPMTQFQINNDILKNSLAVKIDAVLFKMASVKSKGAAKK